MAAQQHPMPASSSCNLPPVTIDGHALFEFSMRLNRALKRFERRFDARELAQVPVFRQMWQQASRKPR